jgi:hypothetical protein
MTLTEVLRACRSTSSFGPRYGSGSSSQEAVIAVHQFNKMDLRPPFWPSPPSDPAYAIA